MSYTLCVVSPRCIYYAFLPLAGRIMHGSLTVCLASVLVKR